MAPRVIYTVSKNKTLLTFDHNFGRCGTIVRLHRLLAVHSRSLLLEMLHMAWSVCVCVCVCLSVCVWHTDELCKSTVIEVVMCPEAFVDSGAIHIVLTYLFTYFLCYLFTSILNYFLRIGLLVSRPEVIGGE